MISFAKTAQEDFKARFTTRLKCESNARSLKSMFNGTFPFADGDDTADSPCLICSHRHKVGIDVYASGRRIPLLRSHG